MSDDWEDRLARLDEEESGPEGARLKMFSQMLDRIRQRRKPMESKYTVVVQLSSTLGNRAFVLETGNVSGKTKGEILDAAKKGGVEVLILPADPSGIENLKWELTGR